MGVLFRMGAVSELFITFPVVRRSAVRANNYVVLLAKFLSANGAFFVNIVLHNYILSTESNIFLIYYSISAG